MAKVKMRRAFRSAAPFSQPPKQHERMPRDPRDRDESESETDTDADTDTDDEYVYAGRPPTGDGFSHGTQLYRAQRGVCRITKIPFGEGSHAPVPVPRCTRKPLSNDNAMLVLSDIATLHAAMPHVPWRTFAAMLQLYGERAEL